MKRSILTMLLLGMSCLLFAQNNPYSINDRIYEIYQEALRVRTQPKALELGEEMLDLSLQLKDKKAEVMSYLIPLSYYVNNKDTANVSKTAQKVREVARNNDYAQYYYYSFNQESVALLNSNDNARAINLLGQMRREATAEHNTYGMYTSYISLGHVYQNIFNFNESEEMYVMAAELTEKEIENQSPASAWLNAAIIAFKNNTYQNTLNYLQSLKRSFHTTRIQMDVLGLEAAAHYMLKNKEAARQKVKEYYEIADSIKNETGVNSYRIEITDEMLKGHFDKAIELAKKVTDETESTIFQVVCYEEMGDYQHALSIAEQYRVEVQNTLSRYMQSNAALQGTLLQTQNEDLKTSNIQLELDHQKLALRNNELALLQAKQDLELNETKQRNTELALQQEREKQERIIAEQEKRDAERDRELKDLELQRRTQRLGIGILTIILLSVIGYSITRIRNNRKLKKTNKQLQIAKEEAETNLVKAEENRRIAEENQKQAERSEQMKTMFIQNMSHEIRTPLNAIVGFSQILTDPEIFASLEEEEKTEFMNLINNNTNLLTTLVNDILNLSDLQSGKYKVALSNVRINDTVNLAIKNVEDRVPYGVKMYYTSELEDDYILYSDQQRIQQVISNFLTNACKYTEKGEIHIHSSLTENVGHVTISVADTGKGIPADKAESIFNRFEKLDNFVQGTGLGLSICRLIAGILHGEVKLDTTYTNGARFVFLLPVDNLANTTNTP